MNDVIFFFCIILMAIFIFFFDERRTLKQELRLEKEKNKEADAIISSLLKKHDCPLWSYRRQPPS